MKVSNLIRRLAREIEQRRDALDELVREAERLTDEIVGLEEERSILEKIATRYNAVDQAERSELANTTPATVPVAKRSTTSATLSLVGDPDEWEAEAIIEGADHLHRCSWRGTGRTDRLSPAHLRPDLWRHRAALCPSGNDPRRSQ